SRSRLLRSARPISRRWWPTGSPPGCPPVLHRRGAGAGAAVHLAHTRRGAAAGWPLIRELPGGYELDDDPERVAIDAVHGYLSGESYWAAGRPHAVVARLVREAARGLGVHHEGRQAGFCRAVSAGVAIAYLADVYVLAEHRGRGLGLEMVREMVEGGSLAGVRWVLHTGDAHGMYRLVGFGDPSPRTMERLPGDHRKRGRGA